MNAIAKQLMQDALKLSPAERAELVQQLLLSFDPDPDHRVDAAWAAEIESRYDAHERGDLAASPAEEVLARVADR
jgi:putative addiction module component (TIGR02574 family)